MDSDEKRKIKDYLNSPDTELLNIIRSQYDTPNADLAKWTLNYRLYDTMVSLNQTIKENSKNAARYNKYMFWIAIFMATITALNFILIISLR